MIDIPPELLTIDPLTESFNIPYVKYTKSGYFGDSDFLPRDNPLGGHNGRRNAIRELKERKNIYSNDKNTRYSTCEATEPGRTNDVMVLKKRVLEIELERFPQIKKYLNAIAVERLAYHLQLIDELYQMYADKN